MKRSIPSRYPLRRPTRRALLNLYRVLYRHYGPRHWWPAETPLEVMVGTILTQNTAWKNVEKAIENLKREGCLEFPALWKIRERKLAELIRPAGYFNVKARRLKNLIAFIKARFGGNLKEMFKVGTDQLRRELLEVNGVGEETADSIVLYAAGKPRFVIDAYTRRVLSRHRYIKGIEDYAAIQSLFMNLLPKQTQLYNEFHAQIVEVGKDFCRKSPICISCPLRKYL